MLEEVAPGEDEVILIHSQVSWTLWCSNVMPTAESFDYHFIFADGLFLLSGIDTGGVRGWLQDLNRIKG